MATLGATALTMADWGKRLDPNGKVDAIVEMLGQTNELLDDMLFIEGNLPTGHRTTVRTGLPQVYWRLVNQGTPSSKSSTAQVDESCGMLDAWSSVDKDLAQLNGNTASFRLSEAQAFIEAMNQEMSGTSMYGNASSSPEEFTGLAVRYSDLSAANARNIVVGGGSGSDNSSVWLVVWGANTIHGIFPKGTKAGISHEDLGLVTTEVAGGVTGNKMRVYQDHWEWKCGLAVKDWRYAVRIPNIDISNLVADSSAADLTELMLKAIHRIPNLNAGRACFYMNRTCAEYLDIQRLTSVKAGGGLSYKDVDGKNVMTFRNIPIKTLDSLTETEATIS